MTEPNADSTLHTVARNMTEGALFMRSAAEKLAGADPEKAEQLRAMADETTSQGRVLIERIETEELRDRALAAAQGLEPQRVGDAPLSEPPHTEADIPPLEMRARAQRPPKEEQPGYQAQAERS